MPSEKSFADRMGRFERLNKACVQMEPPFAPADTDIGLAAQTVLLSVLEACCSTVIDAEVALKDVADPRVELVKTIKERATRALNRVQSSHAWASKLPAVKAAAARVRNMKPARRPAPAPSAAPDAPAPPKRERGGQGYRDTAGHLLKLIGALTACAGYDAGAPAGIQSTALTALHDELQSANALVPELETALQNAQVERLRIFESKKPLADGSHSLRDRWTRIKKAVISQYGRASAEYTLVAGIKY